MSLAPAPFPLALDKLKLDALELICRAETIGDLETIQRAFVGPNGIFAMIAKAKDCLSP